MKQTAIMLILLAAASLALADNGASLARGKELFTSTHLGTNGRSCSSCHPDGKKLEKAAAYDEGDLGGIINQCIAKPLKGKALDPNSNDMKSMIMYIKSLAPRPPQ